ncbi:MAG: SdpA family antimicrobial peptide system protein [Gemmatimonadaceae bacterium]|jgi:antimicrobial peptide system SdpA family protein|nr:SdpA family antimicrobial peptide system protein [Gemmatimonadaceae bacterium]
MPAAGLAHHLYGTTVRVVLALTLATSIAASVPATPFTTLVRVQPHLISLLPEGWGFFTRDPREPRLMAYQVEGARRTRLLSRPSADPHNAFGWLKQSRLVAPEAAHLVARLDDTSWGACPPGEGGCVQHVDAMRSPPDTLVNPTVAPQLCGELLLVREAPLPFAWRHATRARTSDGTRARLHVRCGKVQ